MAADQDVIREFLVSLGFKVDKAGFKHFTEGLDKTANLAMFAGKAVLGVAASAQAMVGMFAASMEKLYYASKRTGASVENLLGLDAGARRIGLSAGAAQEALEGMAAAVRMNPGLRGFMDSMLGKDTSKMDQSKAMLEFVQKLASMPHYAGARFAQMFGIDEKTFLMLKEGMPELLKAEQAHIDLLKQAGINSDEAAAASKEYMNSLRDLGDKVGILGKKMSIELLPFFREINREANKLLDATIKGGYGAGVKQAATDLDAYHEADYKKRHGGRSRADTTFAQDPVVWAMSKWRHRNDGTGKQSAGGKITGMADPNAPIGLRQHNPGNLRGWGDTPVNGGFANFNSDSEGLSAMAGNLVKYSERGLNSIQEIIKRWAPSNENNTQAYIDAVTKRLGVGASDALDLKDPATLARLMAAMIQQEQGYNPYGTSDLVAAANSRLGGDGAKTVTVNQKTDIHIAGVSDPSAAASEISRAQRNVNADITRNLMPRVQ